jgi:hypothetical protein
VGHAPPHAIASIYTGNYTTSADANGNHVMDALIVVGQISRKDGLVVGDPIAQVPNGLEVA